MIKPHVLFLAGTLALGSAAPAFAHDHERITVDQLPAAVQKTIKKEASGGSIGELEKETHKNGKVVYEVEIVKNGKSTEIEVGADGKIIERD
jgi:uncharacterized membrane protein YkoI